MSRGVGILVGVDDNRGRLHSEADHDLRADPNHDLRVSGAGAGHARLLRLERDRNDHLHLGSLRGNPADFQAIESFGRVPLFSSRLSGSRAAKNRISPEN